ncbi:endolytic peptidoglycan transglycosylase RlpA [Prodigiosinella confusarubida]|uniref:Endolytic peptidoglycan transglycosylase RlpA n=1 Tax=Serratia sp. (strain ATCC 39006) TaxID=104623 RepID=A0A2I5TMY4_SERS3|nr:endolytic peptidoglycan transglycosylase RlpA [Serratia sp. ATCC 39006]AUH01598.1 endolytic peptidoglycan transglycosylase RlpA [Serratia sp. ATCC 39006]AUH05921.1 endolytic peptidoglycan transglycosylase RlpA [Serratia sp. ATCC 39006]
MRKDWFWISVIGLALSGCTVTEQPQSPPHQKIYSGPVEEIGGVEPHYEPYNPSTLQDYVVKGRTYKIVKNPENFRETGLASSYSREASGNRTATGEVFDPNALTAAHPTLPIPCYVRVTNLSNGRQLVVRINDRGPYMPGRIIDLSKAASDRLNISNNTKVQVDFINVSPDGSLSGPGTIGTRVAKQSFALPERPILGSSELGTPVMQTEEPSTTTTVRPISNTTLQPATNNTNTIDNTSVSHGSFLGAPTPLRSGVLEGSEPVSTVNTPQSVVSAGSTPQPRSSDGGHYVVQVGALSDQQRAQNWLRSLNDRFHVSGKVTANGGLYRIQLGPFNNRQQATELQQRLLVEAKQQSFITAVPGTR